MTKAAPGSFAAPCSPSRDWGRAFGKRLPDSVDVASHCGSPQRRRRHRLPGTHLGGAVAGALETLGGRVGGGSMRQHRGQGVSGASSLGLEVQVEP